MKLPAAVCGWPLQVQNWGSGRRQLSMPAWMKTWLHFSRDPAGSREKRLCGPSPPFKLLSLPNINFPKPCQDLKDLFKKNQKNPKLLLFKSFEFVGYFFQRSHGLGFKSQRTALLVGKSGFIVDWEWIDMSRFLCFLKQILNPTHLSQTLTVMSYSRSP